MSHPHRHDEEREAELLEERRLTHQVGNSVNSGLGQFPSEVPPQVKPLVTEQSSEDDAPREDPDAQGEDQAAS